MALLVTQDVPKYIREIVQRLREDKTQNPEPGYTYWLYGKWRFGYPNQLVNDAEKLVKWAQRYYADAYIVKKEIYWSSLDQRQARNCGLHNRIKVVISDPVALRFEKDAFYKGENFNGK